MQHERTFFEEIKFQFNHGGMHIRLMVINTAVYLITIVFSVLGKLTQNPFFEEINNYGFSLHTKIDSWYWWPLELFTSIFSHFGFIHFLFNMLFLYLSGIIFRTLFTDRRMLHVYIVGGVVGGLFEIAARNLFPVFSHAEYTTIGASGSLMALFFAAAFYRPNMVIQFMGLFPIRIIVIAVIFVLSDILQMVDKDSVAHFAHFGGALIGALSVANIHSSTNIINITESWQQRLSGQGSSRTKMKVKQGGSRIKTDEEYNMERKANQDKIDKILDKISKSGYESLTKAEKDFLFSQTKK